jgi:hypothetical protein
MAGPTDFGRIKCAVRQRQRAKLILTPTVLGSY